MDIFDILLFPFTLVYKLTHMIVTLPVKLIRKFSRKDKIKELKKATEHMNITKVNEEQKVIPELKKGDKVKVVKGVRSAYSEPVKPVKEQDPGKLQAEKNQKILKRQQEFQRLVQKAKQEEQRRIAEQEKIRIEIQKKEAERKKKEEERLKKEKIYDAKRMKKEAELRKNGQPVTITEKINAIKKKLTYNPKEELENEAKKIVLNEQFKNKEKVSTTRLEKAIVFNYVAKNPNGDIEKSSIEALSRVDVHSFLLAEGYEVYEITAAKTSTNISTWGFKFKRSRLIFYLSQLSAYLKSGIVLAEAVKILDDQAKDINEKKTWRAVYYDLVMGDNLSRALEKRKRTFPELLINMIKTAELTGNLAETLDDMVEYYTEAESTRKQMVSAMTYPVMVTLFAAVVVVFILVWIIPEFTGIYKDLGADLPTITKAIIAVSNFLKTYGLYILLALAVLVIIFVFAYLKVRPFKKLVQEIVMHVPVFGNIIVYNEVTIFAKTFANLINHNVFITDSIEVLSKITSNEIYKDLIYSTAVSLTKGEGISYAFKNHWAFPNIAYQMLITGEKTGRLGPMLEKVSEYYQEQHRTIITRMKSLIEPILIISLAGVVGGILLAVIIPMFGMFEQIQ